MRADPSESLEDAPHRTPQQDGSSDAARRHGRLSRAALGPIPSGHVWSEGVIMGGCYGALSPPPGIRCAKLGHGCFLYDGREVSVIG